jgi:hypothetical protein
MEEISSRKMFYIHTSYQVILFILRATKLSMIFFVHVMKYLINGIIFLIRASREYARALLIYIEINNAIENHNTSDTFMTITATRTNELLIKNTEKNLLSHQVIKKYLPENSVKILKQWLLLNIDNPYASYQTKCKLAKLTNLSVIQVEDWLLNSRKRKWFKVEKEKHNKLIL